MIQTLFFLLIFWGGGSLAVATQARNRMLGFISGLILSLIFSPLMGILFVLSSDKKSDLEFQLKIIELLESQKNTLSTP